MEIISFHVNIAIFLSLLVFHHGKSYNTLSISPEFPTSASVSGLSFTMDTLVLTKLEAKPEGLPTHTAYIGFFPSVDSLMNDAVGTVAEAFATLHTSEWFLPCVASLMPD